MRLHPASSIPNEPFEALAGKTSRCGGADQREKSAANCGGEASSVAARRKTARLRRSYDREACRAQVGLPAEAAKQRSSEAAKQRSSEAAKQRSSVGWSG